MPIIRRVFGPFHLVEKNGAEPEIRWHFNGIRGDKTTAHWVLIFNARERRFKASNIKISDSLMGRSRKALASLAIPAEVTSEDAHPDAWLDERPVMEGTVTDILKAKLSPADIAKATALAIRGD
ncbi:hypothetical protein [Rhizobium sp. SSA_523]|uniref:hypothetical protein n=1 Tax=Rhizobium sp. SSA_523 TaxID=2952477 RepID=UPI002091857E|nr:hypothetical protein [Rhizobium sp. SSA_523]MCO5730108.1 hypothetical protein [Rhizobium sp. SSA_523]WKC25173.1 hypothetical protein QTJ18_14390 [Rhizobium sp. SSA_523]